MNRTELEELIRNGESSGVEFKRDDVRPERLAKEIAALLNLDPKPAHLEGDLHKSLGLNHFRKCSTNLRVRLRFS